MMMFDECVVGDITTLRGTRSKNCSKSKREVVFRECERHPTVHPSDDEIERNEPSHKTTYQHQNPPHDKYARSKPPLPAKIMMKKRLSIDT